MNLSAPEELSLLAYAVTAFPLAFSGVSLPKVFGIGLGSCAVTFALSWWLL